MKLGTENKTKTAAAAGLLVLAAFALYNWLHGSNEETPAPPAQTAASLTTPANPRKPNAKAAHVVLAQSLDPTLRFDLLKSSEDVPYSGSGRDIFRSQPEPVEVPKTITPVIAQGPPPPPPPPPIPLKFYGFTNVKNGVKQVFLSKGEDIFVAKEGQVIDRRYKIIKIGPNSVEVEDVLTNNRQTLPLTAS